MEVLVKQFVNNKIRQLEEVGIDDARSDAWILVEHITGITREEILKNPNLTLDESELADLTGAFNKRANRIPVQHITGVQEFMGYTFKVNENVLVPRQDTESVVESALTYIKDGDSVLDMCTGSGCIAISIAKLKDVKMTGVDISIDAIEIARENANLNEVEVKFIESDLFDEINGKFNVIISNPPYIPSKDIEELMIEVREHDPMLALDGGEDGLDYYKRIAVEAKEYLADNGYLIFEIGYNQGNDVANILEDLGYKSVIVKKDLAGNNRIVITHL